MGALLARRLLSSIPTLLLVTFAVYGLVTLIPGDPAVALAGGANATPERIEAVRHDLELDDPFLVRYGRWLSDAARLDFGESLVDERSVAGEISDRLHVTLSISGMAVVLGLSVGVPAGVLAGMRPRTATDRFAMSLTNAGIAIPNFWLAMLLIAVFSVHLEWLPAVGFTPITESPLQWLRSVVLPAATLGVFVAASMARQLRASLAEELQAPYVRTAWAKGGNVRTVVGKHALRNAAIPAVTVLGVQASALIGGAVIVEQVFSIPGLGSYLLAGIVALDLPVVQGVVVVFALTHLTVSLLVDMSYTWLNPRLRVR